MVHIALLRGDDYRLKNGTAVEGIARYRHQGGGQNHTHQTIVSYNNTDERVKRKHSYSKIHHHITTYMSKINTNRHYTTLDPSLCQGRVLTIESILSNQGDSPMRKEKEEK